MAFSHATHRVFMLRKNTGSAGVSPARESVAGETPALPKILRLKSNMAYMSLFHQNLQCL